jgi:hypothetical protein
VTAKPSGDTRLERAALLKWVPIPKMRISPTSQRELKQHRVDHLVAEFDLEQLGNPVVSEREGAFYVLDGQHRIAALKDMGWGDQQIECWTYTGLSEAEEAERFLKLNDILTVDAFSKFRVGVSAGRDEETDIDRIVHAEKLVISRDRIAGAIMAVGTLRRIYIRGGADCLGRTLRIVRDAYGDPGLDSVILDGIGLLCQRYNGELDEEVAVKKLAAASGGVNGLLGKAELLRRQTGNAKGHCVAAAAVEIINRSRGGGRKLPSWWKPEDLS